MPNTVHESTTPECCNVLERILQERDVFYRSQIHALEEKLTASITTSEKALIAAFVASEKAINKAEQSQKELNSKNNEFRAQLKDQTDTQIPRLEAQAVFYSLEEKLRTIAAAFDARSEQFRKEMEGKFEESRRDRAVLRETLTQMGGKSMGTHSAWLAVVAAVGLAASLISIFVVLLTAFKK